ncbi:SDR family oxidoreductase [Corynebacterium heidelbergense]|uniref:Short-chain dehydrogenase n=1 Tax=Corynebacterium heidelbergense TaxID=2055947 RepID=A0A364VBX2_9CORY|nr:SDR family oxidoreductase [Corynebacterium heidelbergense]RAV34137.1 short-chain dehydrogenase [Corynebacterium heidelbergense]WCZ36098.1 Diacetyl reductase [(S)-acetoin forming] [Corynebacterium heidelbergense]
MSKSIFVSGGAAGLGREVAIKFHKAGWTVGAYDIDQAGLADLQKRYPDIHVGPLDVTNSDEWERALEDFTSKTGGRLDVLDNNAGIIADGDITAQSPGQIAAQVNVNCTGLTLGARAAHKYLKNTPGSHLVNMCSASAIYGQPHIAVYSASKFYVYGMTQALDLEWRKDDIRVVALMPLWAKTKLADVDAASTKRLGVNITPEQVADKVWESVHPDGVRSKLRCFYSVSTMDLVMRYAARLAPAPATRLVNRLIAG